MADGMEIPIEDQRALEVERIGKCQPKDWYGILNVPNDCTALVARRAAIKSFLLIKDRFETGPEELKTKANEATKLIGEAAENLKAGNTYVEVEKSGATAKPPPESEPYTPGSAVKAIYEQATVSVLVLFSDAEETSRAELEILQYNENIRDIILEKNKEATILEQISGFIDFKTIMSYIQLRKDHKALHDKDTTTLSESEKTASAKSTEFLGRMGVAIDEFNKRKGYPPTWNWDKQKYPEVWVATPAGTTTKETTYPPGQTKDGDNILGYRPVYKIDRNGVEYIERCEFVIEVDSEYNLGCMKIATWTEVGYHAGQAYIDQPDDEKLSIAHSMGRYARPSQRSNYAELVGFWSEYSENKNRWGTSYCWIKLKDGGHDIVSKGCYEKIMGSRNAAIGNIYALFHYDETKYIWREPCMGRANRMIREGPHGPVKIQRRMLIENGSSNEQQVPTGKTDNIADGEIAKLLERLLLDSDKKHAQILELSIAVKNLQQTRPG